MQKTPTPPTVYRTPVGREYAYWIWYRGERLPMDEAMALLMQRQGLARIKTVEHESALLLIPARNR